MHVYSPKTSTK